MALGHLLLAVMALAPVSVGAQPAKGDWIDAFPSVTAVAQAAFEELKVTAASRNLDNTGDDDAIAINLAGTYVTLREIIYLKRLREPGMSPARRAKLNGLVASYQEAELTIGRGAAGRRGYITAGPPSGLNCRDIACYNRWFHLHLNASTSRASYRERVLNRLFPCGGLAAELDDVRQNSTGRLPYLPSPSVTGTIDGDVAGKAPAGCDAYGGDGNKNGLCDDWETAFATSRGKKPGGPEPCGTLTLTKATTPDARGIEVEYTVDAEWIPQDVEFSVYRSARREPDSSRPVAERTHPIPASPAGTPRTLRVVDTVELAPDANKPYVIVVARYPRHESAAWFQKHLVGVLVHGYTFRKWYEVANAVGVGVAMADWLFQGEDVEPWQAVLESSLEAACYSPATFAFNWRHASVQPVESALRMHARDRLYPRIAGTVLQLKVGHPGDVVDLHLIGHSRGAVMVSQALLAAAEAPNAPLRGGYIIATLLDPHPANNRFGVQEDYAPANPLSNQAYGSYREFQDAAQDPAIVLPAGAGIRQVNVLFQKNTVDQFIAEPPSTGNLWDSAADWAAALWLWGWSGDNIQIVNRSGVPIASRRLERFADGEMMTHGGVVRYFADHYTPSDPLLRMSPERGNCPTVHRVR